MNSAPGIEPSPITQPPVDDRAGIDRAFDVIRNHTVHTKGYVSTAFKLIEEFGNGEDKAMLNELLLSKQGGTKQGGVKQGGAPVATSESLLKKQKQPAKKKR